MRIGTKQPLLEQLIKWPTITTNDYDSDDDDDEEYAIFFNIIFNAVDLNLPFHHILRLLTLTIVKM